MRIVLAYTVLALSLLLGACSERDMDAAQPNSIANDDYPRGPHGARLLREGEFAIELAIFETGVPPEFHAWPTVAGEPVPLSAVDLRVTLERLDGRDVLEFESQQDYLRSTSVVYEPHSFTVLVDADYGGRSYHWEYESLEGRTTLAPEMVERFGIETAIAGPATLEQRVEVVGEIVTRADRVSQVRGRFDGVIEAVMVGEGDEVRAGQPLLRIESNESLTSYTVTAPIAGIVRERHVNAGEASVGQVLLELVDISELWAELAVYPSQRAGIAIGAPVWIGSPFDATLFEGRIASFRPAMGEAQHSIARVAVTNNDGLLRPGAFVEGSIRQDEFTVPLAVKRSGLQPFRDFTVVYEKVGNQFEVRMLELGRQDETWVEVLGGLQAGDEYVTTNSYILKADIEKSGASHDH